VLTELAVSDLGVIESLRLVLGPGMTALPGETGAGKTMLVEAIELLVGGKADAVLVRPGADEATVEGRFVIDGDEVVLTRVVPAVGRSRGYVNGRLAPASALAEWGARLVDLHGQHAHQSLLAPATQRSALDQFGAVDLAPLADARHELARITSALAELGGDGRARAREIDLLRFQVDELERAGVSEPDEDDALSNEESLLGDAVAHQEAAAAAVDALTAEGGAADALGDAIAALAGRRPFAAVEERLRSAAAEVSDLAGELRSLAERIEDDPERLAAVRERRQLLHDLRRKYGETLSEVLAFWSETSDRLAELEAHDERAAALDRERVAALDQVARAAASVSAARRAAAPALATATAAHLAELAMAKAKLAVEVHGDGAGDDVRFLLAANPGAPLLPLAKVASGGELARAMLALRLVLSGSADGSGPPTLVFDEVDAGIGGTAALAVGAALSALARDRQVLVVTHLPQVAVHATSQVAVRKDDSGMETTAQATVLGDEDRVIELSRMLSGSPDSETARQHATELLAEVRARTSDGS
jgi:DNA repair protein RecN (Recombination protein N)